MSLEEMFRSLPKVPKNASREEERLIKYQRFTIIKNWIVDNTDLKLRKEFEKEYDKRKKESLKFVSEQDKIQKQKDFDRWVARNVRFGEPFNNEVVIYPKISSEFFKPNEKWLNKDYIFIHQKDNNGNYVHKPLVEAYEFYVETKKEADEKLPYSYRKHNEILSLRASGLDVLKTKGIKGYWEYIKRMFKHDSFEKDEIGQQNSKGEIVNYIPIFFTGRVLNTKLHINSYIEAINGKFLPIEETNLNLFDSLKHFVEMSYNYNALEGINANLEICKDVIRKTQIIKEDAKGNITKVAGKFGENSNLIKILNDWIASNVYGQTKVKESFLGVNEKTIDKIIQFNALTMLGLNIFTPIQNVLMGTAVRRIAAIGSEFYTSKDLNEAEKTYLLENPLEMMNDAFEVQPKHKINLLRELFLLAESNKDFDRLQRASKNNYLRTFDSVSEHFTSSLSMLAILNNKGLYNRITVKDGKLILPPDLNKKEITDLIFLIKQEIQSKDGTYTTESKAAISRFLIGRMIMNFRNWIQPTINDRLGFQREGGKIKGIFNHYTKKEKKGYYISLGQFGYALFNDLKLAVAQAQSLAVLADTVKGTYNNLSELDKINLTKCLVESAYLLGTYLLATTLKNLSDDDDDNMFLAFMSYNANRFNTELAFYLPIVGTQQMLDILDSPAVIVSSSNRMLEMFKMVGFDYKDNELNWLMNDVDSNGESKFAKALVRNTPIINQMQRFSNLVK
jgi:hypothetical protein